MPRRCPAPSRLEAFDNDRVTSARRAVDDRPIAADQFAKSTKDYSKEVDGLKLSVYKLNKSAEDVRAHNSELQRKIEQKTSDCERLEATVADLQNQLEMAELYNQQLTSQSGHMGAMGEQLEQTLKEKEEMNAQLQRYKASVEQMNR